jgi:DNA-binding NtrC family response regulator
MSHILVIDDDEQVRNYFRVLLEENGYQVDTAMNGIAGIKRVKESEFDAVILDLIMPEKEGIETLMELRREYPDITVITVSGGGKMSPDNYLPITKTLGAAYAFQKPVDQKELLSALEHICK